MAERMLTEMVAGARAVHATGWRAVLQAAARSFRRVMRRHRDGARVVAAADLAHSPMTASMTEMLGLLVAAGFSERDALIGVVAVFDYTMGATFEEQEDPRPARAVPPSVRARGTRTRCSREASSSCSTGSPPGSRDAGADGALASPSAHLTLLVEVQHGEPQQYVDSPAAPAADPNHQT